MDLTKESEGTFENYTLKKDISSISSNVDSTDIIQEFNSINLQDIPDKFHKNIYQSQSGQNILKHSHKAYTMLKSQQDLSLFCLSLLQFQAQFPLRFYFETSQNKDEQSEESPIQLKDVWLQTQFLMPPLTTQATSTKQVQFQARIYRFFQQFLIPLLTNFKQQKMSWKYMLTQQYTDEKVIHQFNDTIIRKINTNFKIWCKQI